MKNSRLKTTSEITHCEIIHHFKWFFWFFGGFYNPTFFFCSLFLALSFQLLLCIDRHYDIIGKLVFSFMSNETSKRIGIESILKISAAHMGSNDNGYLLHLCSLIPPLFLLSIRIIKFQLILLKNIELLFFFLLIAIN